MYRCRVDFKIQPTTISRVDLAVNMPPEKPVILDSRGREVGRRLGPYRLGQTLVVSCSVLGGRPPPSVTWWRESQVMDTSFQREESRVTNTLTIPNLNRDHLNTILTCQASNSNSSLPVSTSVKVDLTFPPKEVLLQGADEPLSSGVRRRLECTARGGRPKPSITWWIGQRPLEGRQTGEVSVVELTPEQSQHGEVVRCIARVPGLGKEGRREARVQLQVNFISEAEVRVSKGAPKQGQDVRLTCHVDANPPPHVVTWEKDGEPVKAEEGRVVISNLTLILSNVDRHSSGSYSCNARNPEGRASSAPTPLNVHFPPECAANSDHVVMRAGLHQGVAVPCGVRAVPSNGLSFRWVFQAEEEEVDIPVGQVKVDGTTSVMDYVPRTLRDYGTLLCWADNGVGEMSSPCRVDLRPTTPPTPPHNCTLGPRLTVSCKPGEDGGLLQAFHMEATNALGIVIANMSSDRPSFTFEKTEPGLTLQISASNSMGRVLGPMLRTRTEEEGGPAQALPSLNTQGLRVTPLLGALIGIGGALGILTMVLLLVLLCRNKRSSSASSSSYHGVELEKELQEPEYTPAIPGGQEKPGGGGGGGENVFIVDPIYQCSGCPSSYSTLKPIRQPCLPPAPYSSLRRPDYVPSRRPPPNLPEATALLPPPPSLSSGLGSSGSDLDNSRTNSDHSGGHSPRLISDTAV